MTAKKFRIHPPTVSRKVNRFQSSIELKPISLAPAVYNSADVLMQMLAHPRPAGSDFEAYFINTWILPTIANLDYFIDDVGNVIASVGSKHRVAFCAHTDTVRGKMSEDYSHLQVDKQGFVRNTNSGILGADDTTGIFILLNLINAGVPGLYCFFRAEETGGIGSSHFANAFPEMLANIRIAISFDRKGYSSVITHQSSGRCCSNGFAVALASQLNQRVVDDIFAYTPDNTGVFTDTANLTHLIPECTNLSVGYFNEHTQHEKQDLDFAVELVHRLLKVDWDALPVLRDPNESDLADSYNWDSYVPAYEMQTANVYEITEPTDAELQMIGLNREEYRDSGLEVEDVIYCLDNGIDVRSFIWSR